MRVGTNLRTDSHGGNYQTFLEHTENTPTWPVSSALFTVATVINSGSPIDRQIIDPRIRPLIIGKLIGALIAACGIPILSYFVDTDRVDIVVVGVAVVAAGVILVGWLFWERILTR